jgi:hypothetical protein
MVAAAALLAASGMAAQAADPTTQSLQDQINALQQQLKDLQMKAPAAATPTRTQFDQLMTDPSRGAFVIPGTNTTLHVGGFIDLSTTYDTGATPGEAGYLQLNGFQSKSYAGNNLTALNKDLIALPGTPWAHQTGRFQMSPRFTRLNIETGTPSSIGEIGTVLEFDLDGDGLTANERLTYSTSPRLRRAFVTIDNPTGMWLFGQTQQITYDAQTNVGSIDNNSYMGQEAGNRWPMVAYRWNIDPAQHHQLTVGLEAPFSDVVGIDGGNFQAGGTMAYQADAVTHVPDISAKFVENGTWGRFFAAGTLRDIEVNSAGAPKTYGLYTETVRTNSWGGFLDAGAKVYTTLGDPRNALFVNGNWGNAGGRGANYSQNVSAVVDNTGKLQWEPIGGADIGYQHWFNDFWQANINYGWQHQWNKTAYQSDQGLWKNGQQFEINVFYMPTTYLNFGLAYFWLAENAQQGYCLLSTSTVTSAGTTCSGALIPGATRAWSGASAFDNRIEFRTRVNF